MNFEMARVELNLSGDRVEHLYSIGEEIAIIEEQHKWGTDIFLTVNKNGLVQLLDVEDFEIVKEYK